MGGVGLCFLWGMFDRILVDKRPKIGLRMIY